MKSKGERGQSTVEFALIVPLILVMILVVAQVALVAYAQLAVSHIARETARAVAVDPSTDVGHLVQEIAPLGTEHLVIEVFFEPSPVVDRRFVVVDVSYQTPPVSALFETVVTQFEVSAQVKMITE